MPGFDLKDELAGWLLQARVIEFSTFGTRGHGSVDYPRFGA